MTTRPRLLSVSEAAGMLGLPERGLRQAAEKHGHLVRVGRAVRILESEIGELLDKCRSQPRGPGSFSDADPGAPMCGSSKTPDSPSVRRARQIADRLKSHSQNTSQGETASVVPLDRKK